MLFRSQADEGAYDEAGNLYFTRLSAQSSHAKRYVGGTAQNLWRFPAGGPEATPLTADYAGTSKSPMWWQGRLYFATDRDGTMNLWSMRPDGTDLRQLTRHADFGVRFPAAQGGRIVYQNGADLWLLDVASGRSAVIPITLASDFDQTREKWVEKPLDYLSHVALSPNGDRVALTVRGQVFVAPAGPGRLVEASRQPGVRYRQAFFQPDGKSLVALSDESGEVEFWRLPANGIGPRAQRQRLQHVGVDYMKGRLAAGAGDEEIVAPCRHIREVFEIAPVVGFPAFRTSISIRTVSSISGRTSNSIAFAYSAESTGRMGITFLSGPTLYRLNSRP